MSGIGGALQNPELTFIACVIIREFTCSLVLTFSPEITCFQGRAGFFGEKTASQLTYSPGSLETVI